MQLEPLDAIDDDIRQAVAAREIAFTRLMAKDTTFNRDVYRISCERVDSLLDMRHGMSN